MHTGIAYYNLSFKAKDSADSWHLVDLSSVGNNGAMPALKEFLQHFSTNPLTWAHGINGQRTIHVDTFASGSSPASHHSAVIATGGFGLDEEIRDAYTHKNEGTKKATQTVPKKIPLAFIDVDHKNTLVAALGTLGQNQLQGAIERLFVEWQTKNPLPTPLSVVIEPFVPGKMIATMLANKTKSISLTTKRTLGPTSKKSKYVSDEELIQADFTIKQKGKKFSRLGREFVEMDALTSKEKIWTILQEIFPNATANLDESDEYEVKLSQQVKGAKKVINLSHPIKIRPSYTIEGILQEDGSIDMASWIQEMLNDGAEMGEYIATDRK